MIRSGPTGRKGLFTMEKDLFEPIKEYFEKYGYVCDGEVMDIDLYMEKKVSETVDFTLESVAVELKQVLDFKAVQQAALRQKITDHVFIGIFRPKDLNSHAFKDKLYLLKRLGIGLIVVSERTGTVEIVLEPVVSELSSFQLRNQGKRAALANEFQRRKVKSNTGGVHHARLLTAYRENALLVLDALMELGGEASPKMIKEISGVPNTASILRKNYYGWFTHAKSGVYKVGEPGLDALEEFTEAIGKLKKTQGSP